MRKFYARYTLDESAVRGTAAGRVTDAPAKAKRETPEKRHRAA